MKKMILLLLILSMSCSVSDRDIPGVYIFKNEYITDSLIIYSDYSYERIISANKNKNKTLYNYSDKWSYNGEMLRLKNFLNKTDTGEEMLNSSDSNFRSPIINTSFPPIKNLLGNIVFEIDRYNYYNKSPDSADL